MLVYHRPRRGGGDSTLVGCLVSIASSYTREEQQAEEEEDIPRRSSAWSQESTCLGARLAHGGGGDGALGARRAVGAHVLIHQHPVVVLPRGAGCAPVPVHLLPPRALHLERHRVRRPLRTVIQGRPEIARHVIGGHSTQETRFRDVCHDMASNIGYCWPRHKMPRNSSNRGIAKCPSIAFANSRSLSQHATRLMF